MVLLCGETNFIYYTVKKDEPTRVVDGGYLANDEA